MRMTVQSICAWMSGWRPPFCQGAIIGKPDVKAKLAPQALPHQSSEENQQRLDLKLGSEDLSTFSQFGHLK